ncbi:MAG TPA: glutamate 5-kinase [Candidatus Limnocylindria bacterium]|nr:glutamate 5-kinase [Candidatus Limnocylindria bacterium]
MTQLEVKPALLARARRVVVKVGSNVLTETDGRRGRLPTLVGELAALGRRRELVVVTSGAVAAGRSRVKGSERRLEWRQAAAAVGQPTLMARYERAFARHGRVVAQVLLTHADLADRRRYLNARHTLRTLLGAHVVPIVNENDTVAVEELQFGDNDNLSAMTATLVDADLLVILSDVPGLFTADPTRDASATRIAVANADAPELAAMAGPARHGVGTGGMATKLAAARKAAAAGITTVIADGRRRGVLAAVFDPARDAGTWLLAPGDRLTRRKHWIAHVLKPTGSIHLDAGAERAVVSGGRSLLPSGVRGSEGEFAVGDCVRLVAPDGREIGRGLVNYSAAETAKLAGAHSRDIERLLGYKGSDELIHRDDLVVLDQPGRSRARDDT